MGILERFSLQGRVALVTAGAGPLFGSSLTEALAEAGATVVTASRTRANNESYAARLQERGFDVHGMAVDVSDTDSISRLRDELLDRFGRLDVLVNSAIDRRGYAKGMADQSPDDWALTAQSDMVGLFAICQAFLPQMQQQQRASIINIGSIYGVVANDPGLYEGTTMQQPPNYNFVKGGMIQFTRYLAAYYSRDGVRANCISPGGYANEQPAPFVEAYERRVPIGRMMGHDDIQGAVVFLASDAAAYVTGHNLVVDGGWTII